MNYHRFESILAASPPARPRPSTADANGDENDDLQQPQPFRRSHSMRASFSSLRGLKTRLKHPVVSGYSGATRYTQLTSSPSGGAGANGAGRESSHQCHHHPHHHHQHHHPTTTLTTAAAAAAKANVKAKLLKLKETYAEFRRLKSSKRRDSEYELTSGCDNFKVPENIPPKAAAVLLEGASRNRVNRSQSLRCGEVNRYAVTIGGQLREVPEKKSPSGGGSGRLTVNRVSIKMGSTQRQLVTAATAPRNGCGSSPDSAVIRTATIRRSSVWANSSSSSKIIR